MAAVTVNSRRWTTAGNRKLLALDITGDNANTLDTRLRKVRSVTFTPGTNTPTAAVQSTVGGRITITFTSGGAFTNQLVEVDGY